MLRFPSSRQRFGFAVAAALLASPQGALANEGSERPDITVLVDNAKVMRLPERTLTVIIGNPMIADVSLQRNGVVILTGKSFGRTNLIALDGTGAMLAETSISVQSPPQASVVTVQRGLERESYACTPNCQPSVQLGDSNKYFSEVSGQADQRRALATAGAAGH
ncbi:pilus assembly protein N-terminal domain-containing protein [Methylobacterium organophilum]|uniref:Pilus formation protein N-terminal domain-containing protein n=1 Tax=Methylobacterium organophilum TaxID=410 RepID=A0ABQ4T1H4_METOR|nr:pilus assembly protein N-terminal domain-containing protein [Methylobacterium organophilum]GJE25458.1 hypothetical protein LKMONMHP_0296 [Methylobacterium organophilum]